GPGGAVQLRVIVVGVVAGAFGDHEQVEMVLHVGADAGQVVYRFYADRFQVVGRTDAGLHQQLRRADGAAADDHLALGADDPRLRSRLLDGFHADRAAVLDDDAGRQHAGAHGEVPAPGDGPQIGDGGGRALRVLL